MEPGLAKQMDLSQSMLGMQRRNGGEESSLLVLAVSALPGCWR